MKKFVSIILALVLMLGCCSALAAETEARSANVSVTVQKYIITGTYDDLTLYNETGATATYSLNASTSADRYIDGKVTLSCGTKSETVEMSAVTAAKVYEIAKAGATANALSATVTMTFVPNTNGGVKNNGSNFSADAPTVGTTLVIFKDEVDFEDNKKDGNGGNATTGYLTVTLTGKPAGDVYPGDKYTLTATASDAALKTVIGTKATVTITNTVIYKITGDGSEGTIVGTTADDKKSATYEETAGVAGTNYTYWAVAKATITE